MENYRIRRSRIHTDRRSAPKQIYPHTLPMRGFMSAILHIQSSGPLGNRRNGQTLNLGQIKAEMLPQQATQSRAIRQFRRRRLSSPMKHRPFKFRTLTRSLGRDRAQEYRFRPEAFM